MGGYQVLYFNLTDVLNSQGEHIAECIDLLGECIHSLDCTGSRRGMGSRSYFPQEDDSKSGLHTGYYNFEGAENRRQDGNTRNMKDYLTHMSSIREHMSDNFLFTRR